MLCQVSGMNLRQVEEMAPDELIYWIKEAVRFHNKQNQPAKKTGSIKGGKGTHG